LACGGTALWRFTALAGAVVGLMAGIVGVGEVASAPPASAVTTSSATTIASGASHSCLIRGGAAYCWGDNSAGELGNNTTASSGTPLPVYTGGALSGVTLTEVAAGTTFTCALAAAGAAYCWGLGTSGQLGNGAAASSSVPVLVSGGLSFTQISVGAAFACGLTSAGGGYCWGAGGTGQLGNGTTTATQTTPTAVSGSLTLADIDAGGSTACGLTGAGAAYCWGAGGSGQLGNGTTTAAQITPVAVGGSLTLAQVQVGNTAVCALTSGGVGYCWGAGGSGQLGNGTTTATQTTPTAVSGSLTLAEVTVGNTSACGVTSAGAAYCWGAGGSGQLGNGTTTTAQTTPAAVTTTGTPLAGVTLGQIIAGTSFACALGAGNAAYCWGLNSSGQLGDPDTAVNFSLPVSVLSETSQVAVGYDHSCLLRKGKAWCWGDDSYGELGNNTTTTTPQSTRVPVYTGGVLSGVTLTQIVAGQNFTCALATTGNAYCWGNDGTIAGDPATALGNGATGASSIPVLVSGGLNFADITAGGDFACGVTTAGVAYCWGNNQNGQLGAVTLTTLLTAYSTTPIAVNSAIIFSALFGVTVTQVDAGLGGACALGSTGAAYCWGAGGSGQLGNGTTTTAQFSPVAVTTSGTPLATVALTQVSVGSTSTCALGAAGAVYCWGAGGSGQLGNNTNTAIQSTAVAVITTGALSGVTVTQISAGTAFACAIGSAGAAYCWGLGTTGQLGNSASASSSVPVAVTTSGVLAGVILAQVSSGQLSTCVEATTGAFYCWGGNAAGQLGNTTTTGSNAPVMVFNIIPGAPTGVTATPGDTTATIAWTAPANFGTGTLTGYTVTLSPGGFTCSTAGATTCTVTGLTDGTTYTVTVLTHTTDGDSPPSSPVTVKPVGVLSLTSPASLTWSFTDNGIDQQAVDPNAADKLLTVTDNTGTGVGWHITVSGTTFTNGPNTLPDVGTVYFTGSTVFLASTAPTATCVGSCTLPTDTTSYPVAINTAPFLPTAYTVYDTSAGTGKGTMTIGGSAAHTIGWWMELPAMAYAGAYTSTVTIQIVSGP
jgi:alpha-tubulin suppressor-like RCC1 family protein